MFSIVLFSLASLETTETKNQCYTSEIPEDAPTYIYTIVTLIYWSYKYLMLFPYNSCPQKHKQEMRCGRNPFQHEPDSCQSHGLGIQQQINEVQSLLPLADSGARRNWKVLCQPPVKNQYIGNIASLCYEQTLLHGFIRIINIKSILQVTFFHQ